MLNDEHSMGTARTKGLQVVFYLLIINLVLDILISLLNSLFVSDYISELISFSIKNVLIYAVFLIITLIVTIVPVIVGQKYKSWSEDQQTAVFFKSLAITSLTMISIVSILIYFIIFPDYPLLMNPFALTNSNHVFMLISPFWWFFSFNIGTILVFLLYIYLES